MQGNERGTDVFNEVLYALPERISSVLTLLPNFVKTNAFEIRIRAERPVCITGKTSFYVSGDAVVSTYLPENPLVPTKKELEEILLRITQRSLYTRIDELNQGFLSMRNGHRAGICGSFEDGKFSRISSVNIRIARQIFGAANPVLNFCDGGLIIAGPPGSGKTTILRDLARQLSYKGARICVIDTRGELFGGGLDLGPNTDIITGISKAKGAENALRSMFPEYIVFDEIGREEELALVRESFFSGVKILTTVHAQSIDDLKRRSVTKNLLSSGIENLVLLGKNYDSRMTFLKTEEVKRFA